MRHFTNFSNPGRRFLLLLPVLALLIALSGWTNPACGHEVGKKGISTVKTDIAVPDAPAITTEPVSLTDVCIGSGQSFTVVATGTDPLTYQWYHNGDPVGDNSATYSITAVSVGDAGDYYVNVSNDEGNVNSATVSLTLEADPPVPGDNGSSEVACLIDAVEPDPPVAMDACDGEVTGELLSTVDSPDPLTCEGTRTYTFSYTDAAGNVAYWTYTYTIVRNDFTIPETSDNSQVACASDALAENVTLPVVYSDCDEPLEPGSPVQDASETDTYDGCQGTISFTWTYTDCAGNSQAWTYTYTVVDDVPPAVVCQNKTIMLGMDGTASIAVSDIDNGSSDNCAGVVDLELSQTTFDCEDRPSATVTLTGTDCAENSGSCEATVTVNLRPTTLTYGGAYLVEYSDQVTLKATLRDKTTGLPLEGKSIHFQIGTQGEDAITNASGLATATLVVTQAPNTYSVVASFAEDCPFAASSVTRLFVVAWEKSCANYTGVMMASTGSVNSSVAKILLAATITEESDGFPGDIRNAMVQFFDDLTPISPLIPVGLIDPDNTTYGSAVYEWEKDLGSSVSYGATISVRVTGYYRNKLFGGCFGTTEVSISKPGTEFITGGGYLILEQPNGTFRADVPSKNNFGFNVKYNKKGTNLQGNINTIIRKSILNGETQELELHEYQVKGNALTSLAVSSNLAVFTGKANIRDITDPENPIDVAGNFVLKVTMTDNGEPGNKDLISITVFDKSGGIWFTSRWEIKKSVEQLLAGGNLKVQTGGVKSALIAIGDPALIIDAEGETSLQVYPNPAVGPVTFRIMAEESAMTTIDILSSTGQVVQRAWEGYVDGGEYKTVRIENRLAKGLYFVQMRTGSLVRTTRLVVSGTF